MADALKWLKQRKVAVLYGGRSNEAEISRRTGRAVLNGFKNLGCDAVGVEADSHFIQKLKSARIGFCFIALHGKFGEDGAVQGLLEMMKIPYAGSGILSSALSMDKIVTKVLLKHRGIPTAPFEEIAPESRGVSLKLPYVVKPSDSGSAIGVTIVRKPGELKAALAAARKHSNRILAEKFIEGVEVTAPVLGEKVLPIIEIVPKGKFYDFKSKYVKGMSTHLIPARISAAAEAKVKRYALETHRALGSRAFSRIDFIIDKKNQPWVLELNSIPGMTETSLFPESAKVAGHTFESMLLEMVKYSLWP